MFTHSVTKYQVVKEKLAETIKNQPGLTNSEYARPLIEDGFARRTVFRWVKTALETRT